MKAAVEIKAELREQTGKGAARAARRNGHVPVVLYSNGQKNVSLNVEARVFANEYFKGGFMNKVVALKAGDTNYFAVPREIQLNPVTDKIEHADFLQVNEKSVVKVFIPVRFKNVEKSPGIKRGGVLNIVRHELELYCSVANIPQMIEIDVGELEIGNSIHIGKVKLPEGVKPVIKGRDFTIASVAGRQKEEEEVAPVAAAVPGAEGVAGAVPGAPGAPGAAPGAAPAAGAAGKPGAAAPAAGAAGKPGAAPAAGGKPAGKK